MGTGFNETGFTFALIFHELMPGTRMGAILSQLKKLTYFAEKEGSPFLSEGIDEFKINPE